MITRGSAGLSPGAIGYRRLLLLSCVLIEGIQGICVLDNKRGWWLDCGLRDSYLFRVKDFGGITARFDFALGVGDEHGFPHSIANTNKGGSAPYSHEHLEPPVIPPFNKGKLYNRRSDGGGVPGPRSRKAAVQRRSSSSLPFPINLFATPPKPQKKKKKPQSRERPAYRTFKGYGGKAAPDVIPSKDKKGVWVKIPSPPLPPQQEYGGRPHSRERPHAHPEPHHDWHRSHEIPYPFNVGTADSAPKYGDKYRHVQEFMGAHGPDLLRDFRENPGIDGFLESARFGDSRENPRYREKPRFERYTGRYGDSIESDSRQNLRSRPYSSGGLESVTLQGLMSHFDEYMDFRSPPPLPHTTPEPYTGPVIGTVLGEVLGKSPQTPADSDHVPSFAAQLLVVRDAPSSLHPPTYNDTSPHYSMSTKLPRTKFFCEEQEFLPGLYADVQLGCKIFHLCVPAALGSAIQSFLCPNATLFDQSILQCNYWQLVDCSVSPRHFDANQPLALSYRRINAAYLPVGGAHDPLTLSLLGDIRAER